MYQIYDTLSSAIILQKFLNLFNRFIIVQTKMCKSNNIIYLRFEVQPIVCPIKKVLAFAKTFFIRVVRMSIHFRGFGASRAKAEAVGEIVRRSARQMSRRESRPTRGAAREIPPDAPFLEISTL